MHKFLVPQDFAQGPYPVMLLGETDGGQGLTSRQPVGVPKLKEGHASFSLASSLSTSLRKSRTVKGLSRNKRKNRTLRRKELWRRSSCRIRRAVFCRGKRLFAREVAIEGCLRDV